MSCRSILLQVPSPLYKEVVARAKRITVHGTHSDCGKTQLSWIIRPASSAIKELLLANTRTVDAKVHVDVCVFLTEGTFVSRHLHSLSNAKFIPNLSLLKIIYLRCIQHSFLILVRRISKVHLHSVL